MLTMLLGKQLFSPVSLCFSRQISVVTVRLINVLSSFLRLAEFDWEDCPLVVELARWQGDGAAMSAADVAAIHEAFQTSRRCGGRGSPALYVVSSLDVVKTETFNKDKGNKEISVVFPVSAFVDSTPEKVVFSRIRSSAGQSVRHISSWKLGGSG